MSSLTQQAEALLFALGKPVAKDDLARMLGADVADLQLALDEAEGEGRGIVLVDDGSMVELRTAPQAAEVIEKVRRDEYSRDIGRAGLETLAAVLYRGPLSRSEIDFIRGVNSSQILRTLLSRGLLRRVTNPRDERSFLYEATTELLGQLGAARVSDLPDYTAVKEKLAELEESYRQTQSAD